MITEQDKQLLLKDICARLPYGIKVLVSGEKYFGEEKESYIEELVPGSYLFDSDVILKPYLRSMSSMTEEEKEEYESFVGYGEYDTGSLNGHHEYNYVEVDKIIEYVDWLNKHHFDYRGLIPMGLALEAPEGMYNFNK